MVLSRFGELGAKLRAYAAIYPTGFVSYWQGTAEFEFKDKHSICIVIDLTGLICRVHPTAIRLAQRKPKV